MAHIIEIEGIGEEYGAQLESAGINTVAALLEATATPQARANLAERTGISEKLILKWANRADLARIKGIGTQYADLLEAAGVDTVPELARRNPQNLHNALLEVNTERSLVRRVPGEEQVSEWVNEAKSLPRALSY